VLDKWDRSDYFLGGGKHNNRHQGDTMGQIGLFDHENRLAELSAMGDPLETIDRVIKWKTFRPVLAKSFRKERRSNAGRPPYDYVLMFKILVLQTMYGLSDEQTQFQILDRMTFKRFLGLSAEDAVPDEKTIWLFRETLTQEGAVRKLFDLFGRQLNEAGYTAQKGQLIDASFIEVPRQRNTRDENEQIKSGSTPAEWEDAPAKLRQKDVDARWTKKNEQNFFGYKNHANVDAKHKLIRDYATTSAEVHDSNMLVPVLDPENSSADVYADSAYSSEKAQKTLDHLLYRSRICRKGVRGHALTEKQLAQNRKKSRVRARVEHVFAQIDIMCGGCIRSIGRLRAATRIGLLNLAYNMKRFAYLASHA
jgi:IS5 family transposase